MRTTLDLPFSLHRKLKLRAAAEGRSARALLLESIETALQEPEQPPKNRFTGPLIAHKGPLVELTNEQMYDLIDFP